jgi:hypothetical protein
VAQIPRAEAARSPPAEDNTPLAPPHFAETQKGGAVMAARGFVEGRRAGTPDAKISDHEIKVEDACLQTRDAKAFLVHLGDLVRFHNTAARLRKAVTVPVIIRRAK